MRLHTSSRIPSLKSSIPAETRICIIGATGWFGRTQLSMLMDHPSERLLLLSSTEQTMTLLGKEWQIFSWNEEKLRNFSPDIILNFAFLTREKQFEMSSNEYEKKNRQLIERLNWSANLPNVVCAISVSSGAAVSFEFGAGGNDEDLYGKLKREEELALSSLQSADKCVLIARAWSVSGPFVRRPMSYAFSNFILQAKSGAIKVQSGRNVYRRYVSVDDFLDLAFLEATRHHSGLLESGGDLISISDLAQKIGELQSDEIQISHGLEEGLEQRIYASDNSSWTAAVNRNEVVPLTLDEQIRHVQTYLVR